MWISFTLTANLSSKKIRGINEKYLPKHGSKIPLYYNWEIRKVAQREKPRDTPIELHNVIDDYFEKRFSWRARSQSIFTTGNLEYAMYFGFVTLCFPIGENFQSLWGEGVVGLFSIYYDAKDKIKN